MKLKKSTIKRLEIMLKLYEEREARLQFQFGPRVSGSQRSSDWRNATALKEVISIASAPGEGKA